MRQIDCVQASPFSALWCSGQLAPLGFKNANVSKYQNFDVDRPGSGNVDRQKRVLAVPSKLHVLVSNAEASRVEFFSAVRVRPPRRLVHLDLSIRIGRAVIY